jgi:tripartite-type tricarboxylate transporter receptor subunit TctC
MRTLFRYLSAALALIAATGAQAQSSFPTRPITTVVGFAPSGGTDIAARIIARKLSENIGQNVLVENRPGAGGNIATDVVAKANPDGHMILLAALGSLVVAPHQIANLPYNPQRDLAPISMAVVFANVIVVHPSVPATTLAQYIRLANAKPGGMTYGTSGIGGAGHLAGELLRMLAKADLTHVPYKGGGPAMADLLGGQIPSLFASAASAVPHVKAGKIRAIATTGATRSASFPDVPTVAESGYAGYEATNWYAYVAPAKTPKDIIERLNREIVRALNAPDIREQLLANGMEPMPGTSEALGKYIDREFRVWGRVVKEAGIRAE